MAVTALGRLSRDVFRLRSLPIGGCDWENKDVMDYIHQGEHLGARRYGLFAVEGHAERVIVNAKTQVSTYGA